MKLSLDDLKERVEVIATDELLESINGGTENECHDSVPYVGPTKNYHF